MIIIKNIKFSPIISINAHEVKTPKQPPTEVKGRPFYAITYRKSGIIKISTKSGSVISQKSCVTLTPKNCSYTTEVIEDTHIIAIHFDFTDNFDLQNPIVFEKQSHRISELFELILATHSADSINFKCYSLFYELLEEIRHQLETTGNNMINPKIAKAKENIEKNFASNNFNIDALATSLSINSSYLRREFKKTYSISPISYLKNIRLENALSMLLSDYYSIDEIAKKCGYGSSSYFIQVFHKAKGCSPRKYKERYFKSV